MRLPEYITVEDTNVTSSSIEGKVLPAGSFVQPISKEYLPAHVKSSMFYTLQYEYEEFMFVYCHWGIVRIKRAAVRKV